MTDNIEGNGSRRFFLWLSAGFVVIGIPALLFLGSWAGYTADLRESIEEPSLPEIAFTALLGIASFTLLMALFLSPLVLGGWLARARSIRVYPDRVAWRKWYGPWFTVQRCKIERIVYEDFGFKVVEGILTWLVFEGGERLLPLKSPQSAQLLADILDVPAVGTNEVDA